MKALRGDKNQCPGCHEYFNSTGAFEKHRTGKFGVDRRCRTSEEMTALGMVKKEDGFWITSLKPKLNYGGGDGNDCADETCEEAVQQQHGAGADQ